jgi:hypothetical protein
VLGDWASDETAREKAKSIAMLRMTSKSCGNTIAISPYSWPLRLRYKLRAIGLMSSGTTSA